MISADNTMVISSCSKESFEITKVNNEFFFGVINKPLCVVRIPTYDDKIILPSGICPVFRKGYVIDYKPINEDGHSGIELLPQFIDTVGKYILRITKKPEYASQIIRVLAKNSDEEILSMLRNLMMVALNELYKGAVSWNDDNPTTEFEKVVQSNTFCLYGEQLPMLKGSSGPETEALRRLSFFKELTTKKLTRCAATNVGDPGKTADRVDIHGYPLAVGIQPLAHLCPLNRYAVQKGLSHVLPIVGASLPPVHIKGVNVLPPLAAMNVVCMDMNLNDSVIISKSAANSLTSFQEVIHNHDIDSLINCRGGLRFIGRNGCPVLPKASFSKAKRQSKSLKSNVPYSEVAKSNDKFDYKNQPIYRRFESAAIDRVLKPSLSGEIPSYREHFGIEYHNPSDGMKLQSEADLFKGVVVILPDAFMPTIHYADGSIVRADIVCDMSASTKKHKSLEFAHLTLVLNRIAAVKGNLEVDLDNPPSKEWIIKTAQECGSYKNDNLTAEVYSSDKKPKCLGVFPVGVIRVGRHRQHAETNGGLVGKLPAKSMRSRNTLKTGGKRVGFVDTMVQLANGFVETARELRTVDESTKIYINELCSMVELAQ